MRETPFVTSRKKKLGVSCLKHKNAIQSAGEAVAIENECDEQLASFNSEISFLGIYVQENFKWLHVENYKCNKYGGLPDPIDHVLNYI